MHVISARQFGRKDVKRLVKEADQIRMSPLKTLTGSIIATLFYEPSTRTRLSFEAAMFKLGGNVISTENAAQFSSAIKGETLEDTIRIVSTYCDAIVLRHPDNGAAQRAASVATVPIINAGDGTGEHPTQALLDLYTVYRETGEPDNKHYCLVGDLKHGRTIHSLIYLLGLYEKIKLTLVSPEKLSLPDEVMNFAFKQGMTIAFRNSVEEGIKGADVVYMTRLQTERGGGDKLGADFWITYELVESMKPSSIVMHPLPRREELSPEVDNNLRAAYFRQAENGLWIRAALLQDIL